MGSHDTPPTDSLSATPGLGDTVALLRAMIREACENDGSETSGQEIRNVKHLQEYFAGTSVETRVVESAPGRASLIARVRGTDPSAPTLALLGHLDVVPVDPNGWSRNPFSGDLEHGEVWGRGAVDMLYLTSIFATVTRDLALGDTPPRGDLLFLAVADEEGGGKYGMHWLAKEVPEVLEVDEVLSESGGMRMGKHVAIGVAEKGSAGRKLHVTGTPGHASIPYGAMSAAVRVGEVMQRLAETTPAAELGPLWGAFVDARVDDEELRDRLRDPVRVDSALPTLGSIAGYAHAVSRVSISPTIIRSGHTHNVIPGTGSIELDIRTLPTTTDDDVDALLRAMLGPFAHEVEIEHLNGWAANASPIDTPLFHAIERAVETVASAPVVPIMAAGGSDARVYRELGINAYGFGLLAPNWSYEKYREGVHGNDERIDLESIRLTLESLRLVVASRLH